MSFFMTTQKLNGNWSFEVKHSDSWNVIVIWVLTLELALASHVKSVFLSSLSQNKQRTSPLFVPTCWVKWQSKLQRVRWNASWALVGKGSCQKGWSNEDKIHPAAPRKKNPHTFFLPLPTKKIIPKLTVYLNQ